jgi:hypothetical protein
VCGTVGNIRIKQFGTLFDEWLCGFYLCLPDQAMDLPKAGPHVMHKTLCRKKQSCDCVNTDADERFCDTDLAGFHRCGDELKSKHIRFIEESKVCDGRSDCVNGEDEISTPETEGRCRFGLSCFNKKGIQV